MSETALDTAFNGAVSGVINAAPLYWHPVGASVGEVIVATENNQVYALNATTGLPVWQQSLGPAATPASGCGNINPIGVTGTPVIDAAAGILYVEAVVAVNGGQAHELFALSLTNGQVVSGYPVVIGAGIRAMGHAFIDAVEEQRGRLVAAERPCVRSVRRL